MFTSNMAESFNEVSNMIDARHAPIRFAVERLLVSCEKRFSALAAHAKKLPTKCNMLYGHFGDIAEDEKASSGGFTVERSDQRFRLTGPPGVYVVDCQARECLCGLPMSHGIPCRHVFAVQQHFPNGGDEILRHFVAPGLLFVDLQESLSFSWGGERQQPSHVGPRRVAKGNARKCHGAFRKQCSSWQVGPKGRRTSEREAGRNVGPNQGSPKN